MQGVACVHSRTVIDGQTCCCWTNLGQKMGLRFWNFLIGPLAEEFLTRCCVQGVVSGKDVIRPKGERNASPFLASQDALEVMRVTH